jgi:hypothetical protein
LIWNEKPWLGFLDTYRILCVAPNQEIRSIFDELRSFSSSSVLSSQTIGATRDGRAIAEGRGIAAARPQAIIEPPQRRWVSAVILRHYRLRLPVPFATPSLPFGRNRFQEAHAATSFEMTLHPVKQGLLICAHICFGKEVEPFERLCQCSHGLYNVEECVRVASASFNISFCFGPGGSAAASSNIAAASCSHCSTVKWVDGFSLVSFDQARLCNAPTSGCRMERGQYAVFELFLSGDGRNLEVYQWLVNLDRNHVTRLSWAVCTHRSENLERYSHSICRFSHSALPCGFRIVGWFSTRIAWQNSA